ncbi:MAG: CDP-archaeol synthase [Desulfurococcaceae archaeon]
MINIYDYVIWLIKYYLPAMIANAAPVLIKGVVLIDRGNRFIDGKPIFGSNKTAEGFAIGIIMAYVTGASVGVLTKDLLVSMLSIGAGLSALIGDLIGAFIKRRLGIEPGKPLPILDQLDFALFTTLFYIVISLDPVIYNPLYIVTTITVILILHVITNNIAYVLGLKTTRW